MRVFVCRQVESAGAGSSEFLEDVFEGMRMLLELSLGKVKPVNKLYLAVSVWFCPRYFRGL